jgi:hypothetical protein
MLYGVDMRKLSEYHALRGVMRKLSEYHPRQGRYTETFRLITVMRLLLTVKTLFKIANFSYELA